MVAALDLYAEVEIGVQAMIIGAVAVNMLDMNMLDLNVALCLFALVAAILVVTVAIVANDMALYIVAVELLSLGVLAVELVTVLWPVPVLFSLKLVNTGVVFVYIVPMDVYSVLVSMWMTVACAVGMMVSRLVESVLHVSVLGVFAVAPRIFVALMVQKVIQVFVDL